VVSGNGTPPFPSARMGQQQRLPKPWDRYAQCRQGGGGGHGTSGVNRDFVRCRLGHAMQSNTGTVQVLGLLHSVWPGRIAKTKTRVVQDYLLPQVSIIRQSSYGQNPKSEFGAGQWPAGLEVTQVGGRRLVF
jgi:hypothetical protein